MLASFHEMGRKLWPAKFFRKTYVGLGLILRTRRGMSSGAGALVGVRVSKTRQNTTDRMWTAALGRLGVVFLQIWNQRDSLQLEKYLQ